MLRRRFLFLATIGIAGLTLARSWIARLFSQRRPTLGPQNSFSLSFQWPTVEPYLFCVHHLDRYPVGDKNFGPSQSLEGRSLGQDFELKDGFRMYHGHTVPGFPVHPHRGFETITVVRRGYVDHADSIGAAGRYGQGDVQWMTAGSGVQHSEMFPLLRKDSENTLELFQIWLNLPSQSKMVAPHFKMLWSDQIPTFSIGPNAAVTLIAGRWGEHPVPPAPPPDSWASNIENDVQIWLIQLKAHSELELPTGRFGSRRTVYFFEGSELFVNDYKLASSTGSVFAADQDQVLRSGSSSCEVLVLQARPIGEQVVQYGPFVMNSEAEIQQTMKDYQKSRFGGWPWPRNDMVHGPEIKRFAQYPDGRMEFPPS